jgi:outer membrane protein TolC
MFRQHIRPAAVALVAGMLACGGAAGRAQSLDSLIRLAEQTHPSTRAAQLAIERVDARSHGLAAWEPPRVGFEISSLPPSDPNPFAKGETMLMAEQSIPLFGQQQAMARAAALESGVADADLAATLRQLRARVETEYYALWLIDRKEALVAENQHHFDLLYNSIELRYTTGGGTQSDLLRTKLEIERTAVERNEIGLERSEHLARLNALLSRAPETPVEIADSLPQRKLPSLDSLAGQLPGNPALARMTAMARMSEAEAIAQEKMLSPMLMLRGGIGYMPEGHPVREGNLASMIGEHGAAAADPMHFGITLGAMLSVPIAPWSRSGPTELAAASRLESARRLEERSAMTQDLAAELGSAYAAAERARLRRDYYHDTELPLLDRTLTSTLGDFTAQRATLAAVIDLYHMRTEAYRMFFMQQSEYAMALSRITELTGTELTGADR